MDLKDSEFDTPPIASPQKIFKESALGKLISTSAFTDTQEVFNLLEAKRRQIQDIQREFLRLNTTDVQCEDFDRVTKSKFYLMPIIRKTPVKSFYDESPALPKQKPSLDKPLPIEIDVFWYKMSTMGWKPETRQEATLTNVDNKLFLIGGVSRSINYDINVCHPLSNRWEKLYPGGVEPDPRFGHSALEYKSRIIVFGGGTNFNTVHKLRECLNGIKIFHPDKNYWEYLKTSGTYISTRKYHSAAIVGRHMFIYGGLNQKNNLLGDCALLNLEKNIWKSIHLVGPVENAFHTAVAVLGNDKRGFESIYHVEPMASNKIKLPGIYIFGGIGSNKQAHNKLWVVKVGRRPLIWEEVNTEGVGPSPRFLHSMVYNEKLNNIMIFGGRIDVSQTSTYTCFNDLYVLCMQRLMWITVKVLGEIPPARSGHCVATVSNNIYIFGGVSNTCYCSSDMYVLETNKLAVYEMINKEEKKKQYLLDVENYKARKQKKTKSLLSRNSSRAYSRISSTPSKDRY